MRARGSENKKGCSNNEITGDNWAERALEKCKKYCKDYKFLQYHENGHCGCYDGCDFQRPASDYKSKADVYEQQNFGISSSILTWYFVYKIISYTCQFADVFDFAYILQKNRLFYLQLQYQQQQRSHCQVNVRIYL